MNWDQISGALRILLPSLLSYAVGKGWITTSQVGDIVTAVVTLGGIVWSIFVHTDQQKIVSVAAIPEVHSVVVKDKELADAIPSEKVIATPDQKK